MNRITKTTSELLKFATLPIRIIVGVVRAVQKEIPERIEFPYEVRKKPNVEEVKMTDNKLYWQRDKVVKKYGAMDTRVVLW
jgi:hypothetical protein